VGRGAQLPVLYPHALAVTFAALRRLYSVWASVRRHGKKHRLVVEVESLASSWKKLRRVDVKA